MLSLDGGLSQFASLVFVLAGASTSYTEVTRVGKMLTQSELPCEYVGQIEKKMISPSDIVLS